MLKLNIGLSRKVGEANFGSRGASVNLELEVESGLVREPDKLQEKIRHLFLLAKKSIDEELNGRSQQHGTPASSGNGHKTPTSHSASEKQLEYLRQLAGQINGLGVRKLESLSQKMFGKPVAGLTSLDASGLIDALKSIKAGTIDLDQALNGAAS